MEKGADKVQNLETEPEPILKGRRIAITGAGRGLGRALAIVAADHGAEPVLLGRDPEKLQAVARSIEVRAGRASLVVPCDLGEPTSVASACDRVLDEYPTIDALINNGAPWLEGRLDEITAEQITSTVAAAVSGTILVTRGLLPGLHRSNCADIITVVSTSGVPGWDLDGGSVPFYAAKHAQSGFSDKLRHELQDSGIRVSAIYPPDFDDADPADPSWDSAPGDAARMSNRDIVSTLLFILTAPRTCSFPVVVLKGRSRASS